MGSASRWEKWRSATNSFFQEKGIETETFAQTRTHRFAHFCLMVAKSFQKNRCPARAAALAYTTLLALVPLLAVAVSITTSILQKQGQEPVRKLIDGLVNYIAPALDLQQAGTDAAQGRQEVVEKITTFISHINTGTLGTTSVLALLFVGISLLRTIEATFNDIWGVMRGRGWGKSVAYYWLVITCGPILIVGAMLLTTGPYQKTTQELMKAVPWLRSALFHLGPFVLLSLGFSAFYAFMPNTRVHWKAALAGGFVGGCLFQLNNLFNVIYVSKAVSYTSIYGNLGVLPLFLIGLYFSWLIMLFGAQVAYAMQNRTAYIKARQGGSVNQAGREYVGLRVMTLLASRFIRGEKPPTLVEIANSLNVPSSLVCTLLSIFQDTGLVVEVAAERDTAYFPARPVDQMTAYDVMRALRAGQGIELATKADEWRNGVRAEFERITDSERQAAQAVNLAMLAGNRSVEMAPTK